MRIAAMVLAGQMRGIRKGGCRVVDLVVKPNVAVGLLVGMGGPLLLLGMLRLTIRWTRPSLPPH